MDLGHWQLKSKGSYMYHKLHVLLACTAWYDALRLVFYVQNYRYGFHISVLCLQRPLSAYTVRRIEPATYGSPSTTQTLISKFWLKHIHSNVWGSSRITILIGLPMLCRNLLIIPPRVYTLDTTCNFQIVTFFYPFISAIMKNKFYRCTHSPGSSSGA